MIAYAASCLLGVSIFFGPPALWVAYSTRRQNRNSR